MPFAAALQRSLQDRGSEVPEEFRRGDSLEEVLNRHLMTVEQLGGDDVFTCILLLSPDGKRLSYGAAPTVPASYCRASETIEIGPFSGSCGAAAYLGRPVYSVDIESDPVWADYRGLALAHGFRSCWSTPIRNSHEEIIGTFAILHRAVGIPTLEEIDAIGLITGHVADAIMWFRDHGTFEKPKKRQSNRPQLRLISDLGVSDSTRRLLVLARRLERNAADLERHAGQRDSQTTEKLRDAAELSRKLVVNILTEIERVKS